MDRAETLEIDLTNLETFKSGPPHAVFDAYREHAPVHWQPVAAGAPTGGVWCLTRHDHIGEVSRDRNNFTSELGITYPTANITFKDNLMFNDPPAHTRLRSIIAKAFSIKVVAHFESWVSDIVDEALDDVEKLDEFDFVKEVAELVPGLVIADVLGVPRDMRYKIVEWANGLIAGQQAILKDPDINRRNAAEMLGYAFELREIKRRTPGEDVITELVNSPEQLTDNEYKDFFAGLLVAGFETTHTMMSQAMRLMLEDQGVGDQIAEHCRVGEAGIVVDEVLRYVTPVIHMARCAKADLEFHGHDIAKDDMVVMWYSAGNRDPNVFEDPHRFNARRSPNKHLSFGGGGPHLCIGAHLARLEGRLLLERLESRGIKLQLSAEPVVKPNMFINRLASLPVARN